MRSQIVSALATVLLGLVLGPVSLAQGGVPQGTYRQTCQDIRTDGYTLYARCQKVDGEWHDTSINYQNCRGPIINDNGNLRCGDGGGYAQPGHGPRGYGRWQDGLPPGDYKRTCQNMSMEGNKLSATCERVDGGWNNTSLKNVDRCQSPIVNDNGNLRCQR